MKVIAEINLYANVDDSDFDLKKERYLLLHSNIKDCIIGSIKVLSKVDGFGDIPTEGS